MNTLNKKHKSIIDKHNVSLTKGQPLVITGEQGSGKTLLAIEIAKQHGTYCRTTQDEMISLSFFKKVLRMNPETIIVEETFLNKTEQALMKTSITAKEAPNFIFISQSTEYLSDIRSNRRFKILEI